MWDNRYINELINRRHIASLGGGTERIKKQHASGKLTARERLEKLFDKNTFVEIDSFIKSPHTDFQMNEKAVIGDGVVTGYGLIDGRVVYASSQDFTVIGGTLGEYHSRKICHAMDLALETRSPFISINDSGGARIEEGISSLDGYSSIFYRNTLASGVIPQISVILGPCAGGACYSPAICDFIFMAQKSGKMFITGPGVVKTVIGEDITVEELGGAQIHSEKSGVNHFVYDNDESCLEGVRKLLSYLPSSCEENSSIVKDFKYKHRCKLQDIVSDNAKKAYDVKDVISEIVDTSTFFEVQKDFAKNIVIGFARIEGRVVGIVANQPMHMVGCLDVDASDKAARFIRFCDCFNIPLLTLVDVPGFLPGSEQEHSGIIRHGAKMLYAYSEATVPKISVILRKAFGGAYIAMNSKNTGADMVYAWPIAQMAVMGAEGAVDIIYRREINSADNPSAKRDELVDQYNERFMNPYIAAERGYVDEVILPEETRERVATAFRVFESKKVDCKTVKKHGNIPL